MKHKKCTKCLEEKPLKEFSNYSHSKKVPKAQCKECIKENTKKWVEKNRQKVNEYQLSYYHKRRKVV